MRRPVCVLLLALSAFLGFWRPLPAGIDLRPEGEIIVPEQPIAYPTGTVTELKVSFTNTSFGAWFSMRAKDVPSGWSLSPTQSPFPFIGPGATGTYTFVITVPEFATSERAIGFELLGYINEGDFIYSIDTASIPVLAVEPLQPFSLVRPVPGAADQQQPLTFEWEPSANADSYNFQIVDQTSGGILYQVAGLTDTSFTLPASVYELQLGVGYGWKVIAKNLLGTLENDGGQQAFQMKPPPQVGAFQWIEPAPGSGFLSPVPTFRWTKATNITSYRFEVFRRVNNSPAEPALVDTIVTTERYDWPISDPLPLGEYYALVTAVAGSQQRQIDGGLLLFTVSLVQEFGLSLPVHGAIGQPERPTFQWEGAGTVDRYFVEVTYMHPPGVPIIIATEEVSGTATQHHLRTTLRRGGTYRWRVLAQRSGQLRANSGGYRQFQVTTLGPFQTIAPASGETAVPIVPQFSWNASENAAGYLVQVAPNKNGEPDLENVQNSARLPASQLTLQSPFVPFEPGQNLFWRVVASDSNNVAVRASDGGWIPFRIQDLTDFHLLSPANGAANVPIRPTLLWSESDRAESYRVLLSVDGLGMLEPLEVTGGATTIVLPENRKLNGSTEYTWSVVAENGNGSRASRETFTFTTERRFDGDLNDLLETLLGKQLMSADERFALGLTEDRVVDMGAYLYAQQLADK